MEKMKHKIPALRFPEFVGEWEVMKLGDIAELTSSKRVYLSDYVTDGIPFFRGKEISELKRNVIPQDILFITESAYENFKKKFGVPQKDDILITSVGTLGNVLRIRNDEKFYFKDGNLIWLRKITVSPSFLEILLDKSKKELEKTSIGSTQKALTIVGLKKIVLQIPRIPEQQKIADFLTTVDDKINRLTRKKSLLEKYKKGVMQKIFSQEIRFPEFEGEWEKKKLGDFLVEYKERVPSNTKYPVLTSSRSGLFLQKDYFSNRELQNDGEYGVVPKGYFTYRHMSDDSTFMFNINNLVEKGAISKEYPVFTTKGLNSYFLQHKLNHGMEFKKFAIAQKLGGTRVRLYFNKLIELKLHFPSLPEQKKIADFLTGIDKKIEQVNSQIEKTKEWKKGLLQQMFV